MRMIFSETHGSVSTPAIFIDRDGVINRRRPNDYVLAWRQFVFMPGIRLALRELSGLQLPLVVISNQAAVGKGLLNREKLQQITQRMHDTLFTDGVRLTACYYCLHRSDEGCDCRKPRPGMIHRAAADLRIDISRSVFIGDSETDIQAAHGAGCSPVLFGSKANGRTDTLVAERARDLVEVCVKALAQMSLRQ